MLLPVITPKNRTQAFLNQKDEDLKPLKGVSLVWPDLARTAIYDLNISGLIAKGGDHFGKVKVGGLRSIRMEIAGIPDFITLPVRVENHTAKMVGLSFAGINQDERLILQQVLKDKLVLENMQIHSMENVVPNPGADLWLHGPYDTNVMIWRGRDEEIEQLVLEYDNLLWAYDNGEIQLQKSQSTSTESRGYFGSKVGAPVAMGASWPDRLLRLLSEISKRFESARGADTLFRSSRGVR